ncbi:MAP kinase-like protein [Eremomyces bilateralis CBS 781.70]|uniref:mitogen-activated protein kinase kinase kinase n=1 Tax=Eremomyces bilateralis CBS 781.70 TaxID=1392243 RepID=A0A6G1FSZ9_9PEZI|nr:MAP kinase-like protein [Eremomyces bilateralis CBS 781.70]KAF1808812.1 MAP kinase-like protein [Eremomyces bilateralis CBS 781.70]
MAMLASKSPYPAGHGGANNFSSSQASNLGNYRVQASAVREQPGFFASPTESEFSELYDGHDSVRHWDEERVGDWLQNLGLGNYAEAFRRHNISGEVLMEMETTALKDIGIKKVGDRVRISTQIKLFRNKEYHKASKKVSNRESLVILETAAYTPPSSASPRPLHSARSNTSTRSDKRMSRQIMASELSSYAAGNFGSGKPSSRPSSPFVDQERSRLKYGMNSPKKDGIHGPTSGGSSGGRIPGTSTYGPGRSSTTPNDTTPQTARFATHVRASPSMDGSVTNSSILPADKPLIRVIFENANSSVVSIDGCKTAEDIILKSLRKGQLNEAHVTAHCFYVLDGIEPIPSRCRRLNDAELLSICTDRARLERGRLILRKIHKGKPEDDQLRAAANIASQQMQQPPQKHVIIPNSKSSQMKIEKITGESLAAVSYPLSPTSARERERHINSAAQDLERSDSERMPPAARVRKIKELYGGRPPSELIASDLSTYFPEYQKDEIDKAVRMSVRRSRRISRAANRLSTVSNVSIASGLRDAPPLPAISDAYLGMNQARPLRPLSVMRLGLPHASNYRDSVTSSVLEPLDEESPLEPNRKSYVSFAGDSEVSVADGEASATMLSYYDASSSAANSSMSGSDPCDSLNKRLSQLIQDDSEGSDEELTEYLEQDSWENVKYMKGALIGQGSFGSVYLALHAVTGELMAVKQVEMPSSASNNALDAKKNSMVDALKHEIGLLRELKHSNIVQYLGSNSDESHLNIFLEYVPGGSVASMLVNYGPLPEGMIQNFVRQILHGLAYLHSKDIIHRDIKGANILVDNKGSVKISDFGISKRVEASSLLSPAAAKSGAGARVSLQGSVFWMAPEVVRQTSYTKKADIWSLGCLLVEMFSGSHPHPNCSQMQAIFKIGSTQDCSPTIPDNASKEMTEFLRSTFVIDHEKRPTAEELLESAFFVMKS